MVMLLLPLMEYSSTVIVDPSTEPALEFEIRCFGVMKWPPIVVLVTRQCSTTLYATLIAPTRRQLVICACSMSTPLLAFTSSWGVYLTPVNWLCRMAIRALLSTAPQT